MRERGGGAAEREGEQHRSSLSADREDNAMVAAGGVVLGLETLHMPRDDRIRGVRSVEEERESQRQAVVCCIATLQS
eukprot:2611987-Rhodomonas_salina.1